MFAFVVDVRKTSKYSYLAVHAVIAPTDLNNTGSRIPH